MIDKQLSNTKEKGGVFSLVFIDLKRQLRKMIGFIITSSLAKYIVTFKN